MSSNNDDNDEVIVSNKHLITQKSMRPRRGPGMTIIRKPPSPGPRGTLARIFQEVTKYALNNLKCNFNLLLDNHLKEESLNATKEQRAQDRGNVIKEIYNERMTWAVFCKRIRIFPFARMDLCFRFYDNRGNFHDFGSTINLRDVGDDETGTALGSYAGNPYKEGTVEAAAWQQGYMQGKLQTEAEKAKETDND